MARNWPRIIAGTLVGAVVSIGGGILLASYSVSGFSPTYAARARQPQRVQPVSVDPPFIDDAWLPPPYAVAGNGEHPPRRRP